MEWEGKPVSKQIFRPYHSQGYTSPGMNRPIGLILSAIVLSLAALFLLLMTVLMAFGSVFAGHQSSIAATPHFVTYFMLAISVFYAALAVWAILTVIGILRLRLWARYSILIIGGGVAAMSLLSIFILAVSRSMMPAQPGIDPHIAKIVLLVIALFYALIAGIGIWWLVYFNRRPIRELFRNPVLLSGPSENAASALAEVPIAITILGCFFLFGAVCCIPLIFLPLPAFILGFILPARSAHVLYFVCVLLTGFMGYGLLQLKESARLTTIAFLTFGLCNTALSLLPWYQAQFRQYMAHFISMIPTLPGQPAPNHFYTGTMIIFSSLIGFVINLFLLWLLHRHRLAFHASAPPAEPMLGA
jgi:hypothetical protein